MELNQFERKGQELLEGGFPQVIFYGPPGTGKTRAALRIAASILGKENAEALSAAGPRFAFVQFHPSYNYEDFVRGIRVKTVGNNVVYQIENRIFGKMAKRAADNDTPHVLVVDEINRANVSAVLGELIYGLEYRDTEVQTPYKIDDKTGLIIPKNLRIIGTMNTADRTIGQIDYAVRRRFAFVHCPPDESVVASVGGARALEFFGMVDNVFACLSADYDKGDVCIGHSYFLAKSESKLANKIIYQAVPILREYLKDGVLKKAAAEKIDAIEEAAKKLGKSNQVEKEPAVSPNKGQRSEWRWTHVDSGDISELLPMNRTVLSLVRDYADRNNIRSLQELRVKFPDDLLKRYRGHGMVQDLKNDAVQKYRKIGGKHFLKEDEQIKFPDGIRGVVCTEWAAEGVNQNFDSFIKRAKELGYKISCHNNYAFVNVGEGEHRNWDDCRRYGFLSAGGYNNAGKPQFADQLKTLRVGEKVFASIGRKGSVYKGFVGYGEVVEKAQRIEDFRVRDSEGAEKPLLECELKAPDPNGYKDEGGEWLVRVKWIKTFSRENAVPGKGRINIVWRKPDNETLRNLEAGFDIRDADK